MVNYPYNTSFLAPLPPNPVTEFCARIKASYNDDQILDVSSLGLALMNNLCILNFYLFYRLLKVHCRSMRITLDKSSVLTSSQRMTSQWVLTLKLR